MKLQDSLINNNSRKNWGHFDFWHGGTHTRNEKLR